MERVGVERAGADSGGGNGWLPTTTSINALTGDGSNLFVTGAFLNANGDARADNVAFFDGTEWHPVGSDGAGSGPWVGTGLAIALSLVDRQFYAAGSFTSAGGDSQAHSVASFSLPQIRAQINQAKRKATFNFASGEPGSTFTCKLDKKKLRPCASPKTYKELERGKHVLRVRARDRAGNHDATPAVKRFKIEKR